MEEISDRLEIQDLMVRYSYAIDSRDWDALDDVFTPDAHIDYSVFGGSVGDLPSTKEFLASAMPMFPRLPAHGVGDDDRRSTATPPTTRTQCHNPMTMGDGDDARPDGLRALVRRQARAHAERLADQGAGGGEGLHAGVPGKAGVSATHGSRRDPTRERRMLTTAQQLVRP